MKKTKNLLAVALFSVGIFGIASCAGGTTSSSSTTSSTGAFALSETSIDMIFGNTHELIGKNQAGQPISWKSLNEEVATIDDGTVTAIGPGSTKIQATCNGVTATCDVTVGFGDLLPELFVDNVIGDTISLAKGSSFALRGLVLFNSKFYSCPISVTLENGEILSLSGNSLVGENAGEATIKIKGNWNSFTNATMEKELKVVVSKDVSLYSEVYVGGMNSVTNIIRLSLVNNWQGIVYNSAAMLKFKAIENGVRKDASIELLPNDYVSIKEDGTITAKKAGTTKVYGSYTDSEGAKFTTFVNVEITCPVATYTNQIMFSAETPFPLETYFGSGATLYYAKQGETELGVSPMGMIEGLSAKGDESEPLLLLTSNGGFYFENPFIYTKVIDETNFVETFKLSYGKVIDGYYILNKDITTPIDMTSQQRDYYSVGDEARWTFFQGTFDGRGHKFSGKVGRQGLFGGLGGYCTIKNTHFEFTFPENTPGCGLARNEWTNETMKGAKVTLSNLYVTTTNYHDYSYALFEKRFNDLIMHDVYVNLTLSSDCKEVKEANEQKGALWCFDNTISSGPYGQFYGDFRNIYVVSRYFMPIGCGKRNRDSTNPEDNIFACYAQNDIVNLGSTLRGGIDTQIMYCVVGPKEGNDPAKNKLFGYLPNVTWFSIPAPTIVWAYCALPSVNNGGIYRFNTNDQLIEHGVSKVGSWTVKGA